MWVGVKDNRYSLRHTCEEGDKITKYAWVRHDGATYGRQEIVDQGLAISTSFLKHQDFESRYGGDWAVRVQVVEKLPTEREQIQAPGRQVSLFFYIADEGGSAVQLSLDVFGNGRFASGTANEVGWELHIKDQGSQTVTKTSVLQHHALLSRPESLHFANQLLLLARPDDVGQNSTRSQRNETIVITVIFARLLFDQQQPLFNVHHIQLHRCRSLSPIT